MKERQASTLEVASGGDVENPTSDDGPLSAGGDAAAPAGAATAFASGNDRGPLAVARRILRRVRARLTEDDKDEEPTGSCTVLGVSKDVLAGMILGVIVLVFVILLDYGGVIHIESAHFFRDEAHKAFTDPATIQAIEESTGMKVLTRPEYDRLSSELETASKQRAELEERITTKEAEAKEIEEVQAEYDALVAKLGLKNFCNACATIFDDGEDAVRCDAKAGLLAYQGGKPDKLAMFKAMLEVMEGTPACRRK